MVSISDHYNLNLVSMALTPLYDSIDNSKFIQYIPVRQVLYIVKKLAY
jgi:hypothetical protein